MRERGGDSRPLKPQSRSRNLAVATWYTHPCTLKSLPSSHAARTRSEAATASTVARTCSSVSVASSRVESGSEAACACGEASDLIWFFFSRFGWFGVSARENRKIERERGETYGCDPLGNGVVDTSGLWRFDGLTRVLLDLGIDSGLHPSPDTSTARVSYMILVVSLQPKSREEDGTDRRR